jgi:soluble lytic murein transglycosylase
VTTGSRALLCALAPALMLASAAAEPNGSGEARSHAPVIKATANGSAAKSPAASKPAPKPTTAAMATPKTATPKTTAVSTNSLPLPRPRPAFTISVNAAGAALASAGGSIEVSSAAPVTVAAYTPPPATKATPLAAAPATPLSQADVDAVKHAIQLVRSGKIDEATVVERGISDSSARKLVEWIILRNDDNGVDFVRYRAFISANPTWPNMVTLRRRAEAMLWQERAPSAVVRAYFANAKPLSAKGRFALARALLSDGDREGAQADAREAWRIDSFPHELEIQAQDLFGDMITRADEKMRMDRRLYTADDADAGLRAAQRLGGYEPAIAKARIAVTAKTANAKALLDAVPAAAQRDAGYIYSRVQWLRRNDKIAEAGALMLTAPRDVHQDLDEYWIERRLLARKLLDIGDPKTAYAVVRDALPPTKENYRAEHQFTAGWIALRFLNDPATAAQHFSRVAVGNSNPITIARAGYWMGRAAEAAHKPQEARAHYQAAARYTTAYYGQLARARLGHGELVFNPRPAADARFAGSKPEVVRAAEILYAIGEPEMVVPMAADLADKATDQAALAMLADLAEKHGDARSVLLIGKTALGRGFPFDHYAFPTTGLPRYSAIGPQVEAAVVYSIARQESAFNPKTVSSAKALGLMQVTPEAGRYIAKKFNVTFDQKRLLHDSVYNMQVGAAELGDVIERYRGSYILAFAGYNAGPGRVKEWVARYGDPRDSRVDPVDWVERIPFSETRNYVQRVLENVQVYRVRFGGGSKLMIEADLRRGLSAD